MSQDNVNGHNLNIPHNVPQGDPQVIRSVQHLLQLAQQGAVAGVALIGVTPEGQAHTSVALPQNGTALMLTIGALESLKLSLLENIKMIQNPANVSKILKPGMFQQR